MSYKLREIADILNGRLVGDGDISVDRVALPESESKNAIAVVMDKGLLGKGHKLIPIVTLDQWFKDGQNGVAVSDPRLAMAELLRLFEHKPESAPGVHETAWVHPLAEIAATASVGPMCVVSKSASIGSEVVLRSNVFIGEGVKIGCGTVIEPGAVIYHGVTIGKRVLIHGNAVIGADGFGHIPAKAEGRTVKIPQIGGVFIGDDVEIGACSTVDRGTIADTVINSGTKIDNHVQVGHNVQIGENCLISAQSGLSGSSVLKDRVVMAARSGVKDHVTVGEASIVAALGGVTKDVGPGSTVSGFPARDHRRVLRDYALIDRLQELFERVKNLESRRSSEG